MTHFNRLLPVMFFRRRRAVALIVAISVLSILTILVMGLAASAGVERDLAARGRALAEASQLARLALDSAIARLNKNPDATLEPRVTETPEGKFIRELRPALPAEPFYDSTYLRHRPGDTLLTVYISVAQSRHFLILRHRYLLNAAPSAARRLRLDSQTTAFDHDFRDVKTVIERLGGGAATSQSPEPESPDA